MHTLPQHTLWMSPWIFLVNKHDGFFSINQLLLKVWPWQKSLQLSLGLSVGRAERGEA